MYSKGSEGVVMRQGISTAMSGVVTVLEQSSTAPMRCERPRPVDPAHMYGRQSSFSSTSTCTCTYSRLLSSSTLAALSVLLFNSFYTMPREIYVNIPDENPRTAPSFEVNVWPLSRRLLDTTSQGLLTQERRIQDYLHAYRLTGKPPVPSPQQPTDRAQRAALGLPPFMEPYTEVVHFNTDIPMDHHGGPSSTLVANGVPPGPIRDVQIFRPEPVTGEVRGAMFHCIVCQPEFRAWSVEVRIAASYLNDTLDQKQY